MKKIFSVFPNIDDATSYYRGISPIFDICQQLNLEIVASDKITWSTVYQMDALFLQRPHSLPHLQLAQMFKQQGKPVFIDYDDAFFHIPQWNQVITYYSNPQNIEIIKQTIALADVVFFSTEHLKTLYKNLVRGEAIVVPNAHNTRMLGHLERPTGHIKKIVWRGGHTHKEDLNLIAQEVINLSKENPDWNWHFVGWDPWFLSFMQPGTFSYSPAMDLMQYFSYVKQLKAAAWVYPLVNCDFNVAKSNINWMEASWAGSMCLAQDLPEFNKPGCATFKTPKEFSQKIRQLMSGKVNVMQHVFDSQQYIKDNLLLSMVNEPRVEAFKRLLGV